MSPFKYITLLFSFLFVLNVTAQDNSKDSDVEEIKKGIIVQRIETIAENYESEDVDLTTLFDDLYFFIDHPINLNRTSFSELQALYLLTDIQINNLMIHIEKYGKLIAIYELQTIPGYDMETIYNIRPFVTINRDIDQPILSPKKFMFL